MINIYFTYDNIGREWSVNVSFTYSYFTNYMKTDTGTTEPPSL